jgi:tRNA modification GTPase
VKIEHEKTICALATGGGMSAIAVIRVSGKDAFVLCDKVFIGKKGKKLAEQKGYTIHFGEIHLNDNVIDEVLVSVFRGPHSYTGEDTLEISCHGSTFIQQEILSALYSTGIQAAKPGEYTLRSFLNGKMDLSQAEAVADLISSENRASHDLAIKQLRGGFSQEIAALRERLMNFAALIELELDFSSEDVEFADRTLLRTLVNHVIDVVHNLCESYAMGNVLKQGIPVTIAGRPNAGKSTLLNALLNEERAIVSPIAGTTRDSIEDSIVIDGISFRFIDTAGLRDSDDEIENIGIERSYAKIKEAEIVLYLFDATTANQVQVLEDLSVLREQNDAGKFIIPVGNKVDQLDDIAAEIFNKLEGAAWISALKKDGIMELKTQLLQWVNAGLNGPSETIVTNARHVDALRRAEENLLDVRKGLDLHIPGDLLAIDIRAALSTLSEITGNVDNEDLLGHIFGKFCIGK